MGLKRLPLKSGVVKDDTVVTATGYAVDSDKVRFARGKVESLPGYVDATLAGQRMLGVARGLHAWNALNGLPYAAIGTSSKLYAYQDGVLHDITPFKSTGTLQGPFSTTAGSASVAVADATPVVVGDVVYLSAAQAVGGVTIGATGQAATNPFYAVAGSQDVEWTFPAHGLTGDRLASFTGATAFGGITLTGNYTVSVVDANTLAFQVDAAATATGAWGGTPTWSVYDPFVVQSANVGQYTVMLAGQVATVTAQGGGPTLTAYELSAGLVDGAGGGGYGTGPYSTGPYGANTVPAHRADYQPRTWSMDHVGEDLLANPLGGTIYLWAPCLSRRAVPLPNCPPQVDTFCVTNENAVLALGCTYADVVDTTTGVTTKGTYDPMLARWTAVSELPDPTAWAIDGISTAGQVRLQGGSTVMAGRPTKSGVLVWTDYGLQSGAYTSSTTAAAYVFDPIGAHCGAIGPNSVIVQNDVAYWLGQDVFWNYAGGAVSAMASPVRHWLFDNLDPTQAYKAFAFYDAPYGGVGWLYPHAQLEVNRYVRLDTPEVGSTATGGDPMAGWSVGTFPMTAWIDSGTYPDPLSARLDGMLCRHGEGLSDAGSPRTSLIAYAPVELDDDSGDAERVWNINRVLFDAVMTGTVNLDLYMSRWPDQPATHKGPYPLSQALQNKRVRGQGRFIGLSLTATGTTNSFRFGDVRADVSPGPRR